MFAFLLVVHAIIAAALVTVILMQRSEGGGLGMGGSPSGLMSARGAADFLTRATTVLASLFVGMSILLAVLAATNKTATVDTSLARTPGSAPISRPQGPDADAGTLQNAAAAAAAGAAPTDNSAVPLAR
jgi:preprotein translocase subunit SecG